MNHRHYKQACNLYESCNTNTSLQEYSSPKKTPLQIELEGINGIPLKQLGQARAEVRGRVSVVTPTTASRARFHPQLWQCFLDQSWPDKELVVVETYHDQPSEFFQHIAREDT